MNIHMKSIVSFFFSLNSANSNAPTGFRLHLGAVNTPTKFSWKIMNVDMFRLTVVFDCQTKIAFLNLKKILYINHKTVREVFPKSRKTANKDGD